MRVFFIFAFFACGILCAGASNAKTLVIGAISENIREEFARYKPLTELLAKELASEGIDAVELEVLPGFQSMSEALRSGKVHIFVDSPLVITIVMRDSGARPVLKRWKNGVGSYYSVVIASVESNIKTLEDLAGHRVAFEERESSSGYMLPAGLIRQAGLPMAELAGRNSIPPDDTVGFVFTGDDDNTLSWLFRGWVDAAGTDPQSFAKLEKAAPGRFQIIAHSRELPRNILVLSSHVDTTLEARLVQVLTGLDDTPAGKVVLKSFNNTTRFETFGDDIEQTIRQIESLLDRLKADKLL